MKRRLFQAGIAVATICLLAFLWVVGMSEFRLRSYDQPELFTTPIPKDTASLERGKHLTRTRGCFGCHGQNLEGQVFEEEWPWVRRAVAPNLAQFANEFDGQTLANAIRWGVGHDGRALWSMPSYNFRHLSDADVAAIIAFLRSAPVVEQELPRPSLGMRARWALARNDESHMADWTRDVPATIVAPEEGPEMIRGEQLAMTSCNECHGLDLRGGWQEFGTVTPDLAIVAAYSWEDFRKLMRTGVPIGERNLGLMKMVALDRFAYFTEREMLDLYTFLQSLPERPVPADVFWRPELLE